MVRRPKSRPVAKAKSAQTDRDEAEGESPASRPREKSAQTVPAAENIGPHASSTRPGRIEIASGEQASATAQRPKRSHRKAAPMPVDAELTKSPRGSRNAKRAEVLPGVTIPDAERGSELTPPQARSKPRGRAGAKEKQAEARAPEVMERLASPVPDDSERPPAAGLRRSRKQRDEPAKAQSSASRRRKAGRMPAYLAAELGQPLDRTGEPVGTGAATTGSDTALLEYTLRLWRQMQFGSLIKEPLLAIDRAELTIDDIWAAGVTDTISTSSTPDEIRRYRQKLLFRANLLEALLTETVADLHRLERTESTSARPTGT
jgi:hypothetical protein